MIPLAVIAALLTVGALTLVIGLRGKQVGADPLCARCTFNLQGLYPGAGPCPECGAELTGSRAVRIGHRRRRRGMVAAGAIVVIVAAVALATLGWGAATKFNWNTLKPARLLLYQASSATSDEGVIKELWQRFRHDRLSSAVGRALVDRALARQADAALSWDTYWGTIIEIGRDRGMVSDEQWGRFAEGAGGTLELGAFNDPMSKRQGRLYYTPTFVVGEGRGGLSTTLTKRFHIERLVFDGREVPIPPDWYPNVPRSGGFQLGLHGGFSNGLMPVPDATGTVHVQIDVTETIEDASAPSGGRVLANWLRQLEADVDVSGARENNTYPPPGPDGWAREAPDPKDVHPIQSRPIGSPAATSGEQK